MTRRLPFPALWFALLIMWLALNQSTALSHVLIGAGVATAAVLALAVLGPPRRQRVRKRVAIELLFVVLADVMRSNIAVARIVLFPRAHHRRAGFAHIPLQLRDPTGLAILACIITATPGTAWAGYDSTSGVLTLHVLDLVDEAASAFAIQDRYERRLIEMFQ
jgi:multicomponent K+:H+ antiporter subunit E